MPAVRAPLRVGGERLGGVLSYPLKALYEEVAFIAYHFHWPIESVMNLEHADRRQWVAEVSAINHRINEGTPT